MHRWLWHKGLHAAVQTCKVPHLKLSTLTIDACPTRGTKGLYGSCHRPKKHMGSSNTGYLHHRWHWLQHSHLENFRMLLTREII